MDPQKARNISVFFIVAAGLLGGVSVLLSPSAHACIVVGLYGFVSYYAGAFGGYSIGKDGRHG